jgi:signal transduction histidine kinase
VSAPRADDAGADAGDLGVPAEWWARLSHDLRGPLGPIRMAVQMLRGDRADAGERQEALQVIDRQVDRLLAEIEDVADLVRLRNGAFALRTRSGDLNLVLDTIASRVSLVRALAERNKVLDCAPADADVAALYDPARLCALAELVLRKAAATAGQGDALSLGVEAGDSGPALVLRGFGPAFFEDAEIAWLLGTEGADAAQATPRTVVAREFARRGGIAFEPAHAPPTLRLRIPRATAAP